MTPRPVATETPTHDPRGSNPDAEQPFAYSMGGTRSWQFSADGVNNQRSAAAAHARPRVREATARASGKQAGDRLGLHQFARLIEVVVDDGFRVDAKGVVDARQQLPGVHRDPPSGAEPVLSDLPCTYPRLIPPPATTDV